MITKFLASMILMACGMAAQPLACNLKALTQEERQLHANLSRTLFSAVAERREQDDGYRYRLNSSQVRIADVGQWIAFEHRCCPFFRFRLDVDEGGAVWLTLAGGAGVKQFIEAEFRR